MCERMNDQEATSAVVGFSGFFFPFSVFSRQQKLFGKWLYLNNLKIMPHKAFHEFVFRNCKKYYFSLHALLLDTTKIKFSTI